MFRRSPVPLLLLSLSLRAQVQPVDKALLEKTRALYDAPFRRGLINFDCAVGFDMEKHVIENFGKPTPAGASIIKALQPIHYHVFVDRSGVVVSAQSKLPDLSSVLHAAEMEESNRNLLQAGIANWTPYAEGSVLPLGPTQFHFEKTTDGYKLTMNGDNLSVALTLDKNLQILTGLVEKPMHIELTTSFINAPNGFVLADTSTNTNHTGTARFHYTYQTVDGFQIPETIRVASEQNLTWNYRLTDCKATRGLVVEGLPLTP